MKERFVVFTNTYVLPDSETYVGGDKIGTFGTEAEALKFLKSVMIDEDSHIIEREVPYHIEGEFWDWEADEDYGCKYIYEF